MLQQIVYVRALELPIFNSKYLNVYDGADGRAIQLNTIALTSFINEGAHIYKLCCTHISNTNTNDTTPNTFQLCTLEKGLEKY